MKAVHLATTTDVVAWIAANVAKTIAGKHAPGHDLNTVMRRMTSDNILGTIRTAYVFRCERGYDRPESIKMIGCRVIAEYCREYGL